MFQGDWRVAGAENMDLGPRQETETHGENSKKEEGLKGFDPSLSLKDQLTKTNDQMCVLIEEKEDFALLAIN